MAKFEEEKVINALHPEKAEVGKKYWFADSLLSLKRRVVNNDTSFVGELKAVHRYDDPSFQIEYSWQFIYPYEKPKEKKTWFEDYLQLFPKSYQKETCEIVVKETCKKILEEVRIVENRLGSIVFKDVEDIIKDLGVEL